MLFIVSLALFLFVVFARWVLKWKFLKTTGEYYPSSSPTPFLFVFLFTVFIVPLLLLFVVVDIADVNKLKAQNINMLPTSSLKTVYDEKVLQLAKVQEQIVKAFDKNKFQVEVKSLEGVSVYAMPMSANGVSFQGLGDVEKGGAEKLKLLETLIEKQYALAEQLIEAKRQLNREDYYKRNAEIMMYENSVFDGIIVRALSIKSSDPLRIVENQVYFPKN